jgi:hypothetical protein
MHVLSPPPPLCAHASLRASRAARVCRPRGRCCVTPRASLGAQELHPLRAGAEAGAPLSAPLASLRSAGVFAVYDAQRTLVYVGVTRQLADSLSSLAQAFPPDAAAFACAQACPGAAAPALQSRWREWVTEHGALPPGNAPGADARWAARPRAAAAPAAARAAQRVADTDAGRWADPAVDALLTADVAASLAADGYVVLDGVMGGGAVAGAARGCAALERTGALRAVPSQVALGRRDRSAAVALPAPGAPALAAGYGSAPLPPALDAADAACLAAAAAVLMAVPHALMRHSSATAAASLAPPQSLQLALYDGDGSYYARHVDNPGTEAPGARDGPPGLRTGDRAVTAIIYLNAGWTPDHGGELRLWPPGGTAALGTSSEASSSSLSSEAEDAFLDVAPLAGRLLLFDSARVEHAVRPARLAARWALSAWVPRADACV